MSAKNDGAPVRPSAFQALRAWLGAIGDRPASAAAPAEGNPFLDGEGHLDLPARERLRRLESFSAG